MTHVLGNEAAEYTHRIMTDRESLRPVLQVIDFKGNSTEIDLSDEAISKLSALYTPEAFSAEFAIGGVAE